VTLDLGDIPIVDNHCHSLLREQPADDAAFRVHLTESTYPAIARDHVETSILYRRALVELAGLFGCEPVADAIHEARRAWGVERIAREIVRRGNFRTLLVDTGYEAPATFTLDELRALAPARVEEVLRLEPLIERLILEWDRFDRFVDAYRAAITDLRSRGGVGLKSIIAYRSGLQVEPVGHDDAARAFAAVRDAGLHAGGLRIESKPLLDHLIVIAVEEAARQGVPIQFHTGLGDPDLDLTQVDPAALRFLFSDRFRAAPIVLLHTGYPYVRSTAYLAAMYPNVYADMALRGGGGDPDLPRAPRAGAGQQAPVQHGCIPGPGALLDRGASRAPRARDRPRRAHGRGHARGAHGARLGRADAVAERGSALRPLRGQGDPSVA